MPLGGNALRQEVALCVRGQIPAQRHRDAASRHRRERDQEQCGVRLRHRARGHDEDQRRHQAVVKPKHDLAQPVTAVQMLFLVRNLAPSRRFVAQSRTGRNDGRRHASSSYFLRLNRGRG